MFFQTTQNPSRCCAPFRPRGLTDSDKALRLAIPHYLKKIVLTTSSKSVREHFSLIRSHVMVSALLLKCSTHPQLTPSSKHPFPFIALLPQALLASLAASRMLKCHHVENCCEQSCIMRFYLVENKGLWCVILAYIFHNSNFFTSTLSTDYSCVHAEDKWKNAMHRLFSFCMTS